MPPEESGTESVTAKPTPDAAQRLEIEVRDKRIASLEGKSAICTRPCEMTVQAGLGDTKRAIAATSAVLTRPPFMTVRHTG